jgi:hypothetical protein
MIGAEDKRVRIDQKNAPLALRRKSGSARFNYNIGVGGFLLGSHAEMLTNTRRFG